MKFSAFSDLSLFDTSCKFKSSAFKKRNVLLSPTFRKLANIRILGDFCEICNISRLTVFYISAKMKVKTHPFGFHVHGAGKIRVMHENNSERRTEPG